jgi:hypothetical protein
VSRIHAEERLLGMPFGDEYRAYTERTSGLLPGVYGEIHRPPDRSDWALCDRIALTAARSAP